jgi:hypothetical protein
VFACTRHVFRCMTYAVGSYYFCVCVSGVEFYVVVQGDVCQSRFDACKLSTFEGFQELRRGPSTAVLITVYSKNSRDRQIRQLSRFIFWGVPTSVLRCTNPREGYKSSLGGYNRDQCQSL